MKAVKTIGTDSESTTILRVWASLGTPGASWNPVAKMVRSAEVQAERLESRLIELLESSDEVLSRISLCEPLFADAGLNRWLTEDREEAYSDWLEWILGQLDLLLTIDDFLMLVIEVKKYSAEASDTAKQKGYYEWLRKQHSRHLKALLLVPDAAELEYEKFSRLLWEDVCIRLRRLLPELHKGIGPVKTAMFVAFISAVETNLLNLVAPKHADAVERISYARTIKHIEKYLRGSVA